MMKRRKNSWRKILIKPDFQPLVRTELSNLTNIQWKEMKDVNSSGILKPF